MAASRRSGRGRGPFRPRYDERSSIATAAAAFRAADCRLVTHRSVHEEGYQVERQADGELCFREPNGRVLPRIPPPAAVSDAPVELFRAHHDTKGLHINARTSMPGWLGERLDVGWAVDVLHPLAASSR